MLLWYTISFVTTMESARRDQGERPLAIVLPGKLDHAEYASYVQLNQALEEAGYNSAVLDMYELEGVVPEGAQPEGFICEWKPSDYFRLIHQAITNRTDQPATLVGFSYGAQVALMYSRIAAAFNLGPVDKTVALMPPNYWQWEAYDAGIDLAWMSRHYNRNGKIDLSFTHDEGRSPSRANLSLDAMPDDGHTVRITRRTINSHLMPFQGLLPHDPLPVGVMGLIESRLLRDLTQDTLLVGGKYDTLTPNFTDRVRAIHESLASPARHDYVELPVAHDYRVVPGHISLVNQTVVDWLAE